MDDGGLTAMAGQREGRKRGRDVHANGKHPALYPAYDGGSTGHAAPRERPYVPASSSSPRTQTHSNAHASHRQRHMNTRSFRPGSSPPAQRSACAATGATSCKKRCRHPANTRCRHRPNAGACSCIDLYARSDLQAHAPARRCQRQRCGRPGDSGRRVPSPPSPLPATPPHRPTARLAHPTRRRTALLGPLSPLTM